VPYLLDTNILLRSYRASDPEHPLVLAALQKLRQQNEPLFTTAQSMVELACVLPKPTGPGNGMGMSSGAASLVLQRMERLFPVLPDTPEVYRQWVPLFSNPGAVGRQVYDMRIVAAMQTHGLSHLLTLDAKDFNRYRSITVVHPRDL
jgi:predicted nucleic acid-binding protein